MVQPGRTHGPRRAGRHRPPKRGYGPFVVGLVVLTVAAGWWRLEQGGAGEPEATEPFEDATEDAPAEDPEGSPGGQGGPAARAAGHFAELGYPVFCGGGNQPVVALTFDDGPGPYTHKTFRVLRKYRARATFFINGIKLEDRFLYLLPKLQKVGEIGNHSWSHRSLAGAAPETLYEEMDALQVELQELTGKRPRAFRPPFGNHDEAVDARARELGLVTVMWSVDTLDSEGATAEEIWETLQEQVRPGAIVLMHENRGTTQANLRRLLEMLRARGLRPVTLSQLLAVDPPSEAQLRDGDCSPQPGST